MQRDQDGLSKHAQRWSLLLALVTACAGARSSEPRAPFEACPRLAQVRPMGFPFDPSGCECVATERDGGYPDLGCVCSSGSCPRNVNDGLAYLWQQCSEE